MNTRSTLSMLALVLIAGVAAADWQHASGFSSGAAYELAACGTVLFATNSSTVFRSTDEGTTWTTSSTMNTIRCILSYDSLVFVGTGGDGIYRTTDLGSTWTTVNEGLTRRYVACLVVTRVGGGGTRLFAGTYDDGVFLSTNNGESWVKFTEPLGLFDAAALAVAGDTILVGTIFNGMYRSTDLGVSWSPVTGGLSGSVVHAVTASATTTLASTDEGLFRSTDRGTSWTAVSTASWSKQVGTFLTYGKNVFSGTTNDGVLLSTDNGITWAEANTGYESSSAVAFSLLGRILFAGSNGNGIFLRPLAEMLLYGDLQVTVYETEGGRTHPGAVVELYDQGGALAGAETTDVSGTAIFLDIGASSIYTCRVAVSNDSDSPFDTTLFWGMKAGMSVSGGLTTTDVFTRNTPQVSSMAVFDNATGVEVTHDTVLAGTRLRFELVVANPSVEGAAVRLAAGRLVVDRKKSLEYDCDQTSEFRSFAIGESGTLVFYCTPDDTGAYASAWCVLGIGLVTDASSWAHLFTVEPADVMAPGPPVNLAASPSTWHNAPDFTVDWTPPTDPSGIAAAWYKRGSVPLSATDGTRCSEKPLEVLATAEGGQALYVWLEDGAGNVDHAMRAMTILYCDVTPPTGGTIAINGGTATTSSLLVALETLSASDAGGSGIARMHFSNGSGTWSDWEQAATRKEVWDLSSYGGTSTEGTKTVSVQYRDGAGNTSQSFSDAIYYQGTDGTPPGTPLAVTVSPAGWTNVNSFSVDWVNPTDSSGIAAVWYKRGAAPTSSYDGTRSIQKPLALVATAQGGQQLHLWLEDGSGNKDCTNRATAQLLFDGIAPSSGTIVINNGALTTISPVVTLNDLAAHESGGSGLHSMRFSNDTSTWTAWEVYSATRSGWDLTSGGGGPAEGVKSVYVQFRDAAGNVSDIAGDKIVYATTSVELWNAGVPDHFVLGQNFPNPFNPSTVLPFDIAAATHTSLIVVNMLGQEVAVLVSGFLGPGSYRVRFDASNLPSGTYLCRLHAGQFVQTRRLLLLK